FQIIGDLSKSNYEKIKTWQGEYTFVERFVFDGESAKMVANKIKVKLPSEFITIQKGKFTFCIDILTDSLFVDYLHESISLEDLSGNSIPLKKDAQNNLDDMLMHVVSIVTPKEFYSFYKNHTLGSYPDLGDRIDRGGRVAFRYPSMDTATKIIAVLVDPRKFMICGDEFFWERCQEIASKIHPLHIKTDESDSNLYLNEIVDSKSVRYQIYNDFNGEDHTVFEYIVDGNSAFNVIKYANGAGFIDKGYTMHEKNICEYKKVDDVYIPSIVEKNLGETSKKGLFQSSNRYELVKAEINKPIPADFFTIKQLGLENGDRFYDEIENKLFDVVDNGKIIPMKPGTSISWQPKRISIIRIVLIVIGCLSVLIGIYRQIRRRKQ
ncbi:MAG: hypothetical protein LBE18_02690, partial [Planctomycetaceae bacterium]|nr:hypothetical protein [Planctomycetaceae bacterium]